MKTLTELFELVAKALEVSQISKYNGTWFIDYAGHVNKIHIRYYRTGWSADAIAEIVDFKLDIEGIQGAYWFIKTRLG